MIFSHTGNNNPKTLSHKTDFRYTDYIQIYLSIFTTASPGECTVVVVVISRTVEGTQRVRPIEVKGGGGAKGERRGGRKGRRIGEEWYGKGTGRIRGG